MFDEVRKVIFNDFYVKSNVLFWLFSYMTIHIDIYTLGILT